jgi:hypothetical protein
MKLGKTIILILCCRHAITYHFAHFVTLDPLLSEDSRFWVGQAGRRQVEF